MRIFIGAVFALAILSMGLVGYVVYQQYGAPTVMETAESCKGGDKGCVMDLVRRFDPEARFVRTEPYTGISSGTTYEFVNTGLKQCERIKIEYLLANYSITISGSDFDKCLS